MIKNILYGLLFFTFFFTGGKSMANTLSQEQQAIVQVAVQTARGDMSALKTALTNALNTGVSVNTLKEILVQAYAYCGFPRSLNALNELMQLTEERHGQDTLGATSPVLPNENSLKIGTQNQTQLVGAPVTGKIFDFAPAIDAYLKAHLFGDIFARDTVDWQTRELATIKQPYCHR